MKGTEMTTWVYNDGGRAEAGYKSTAADCVVRALAIAMDLPYKVIYEDLRNYLADRNQPSPRNGVRVDLVKQYFAYFGFRYRKINSETVTLHKDELPKGRVIANLPKHVTAVIDGIVNDTYDPNQKKHQRLLGYWILPERKKK
jgi:hypothetical protein